MKPSIFAGYSFRDIAKIAVIPALVSCTLALASVQTALGAPQVAEHLEPSAFVGTWEGICADKKPFVTVALHEENGRVMGTVSIGNMHGDADGDCEEVVDPPTPEHAQQIHDVKLENRTLSFSWGRKMAKFQMQLIGSNRAELKFFGTPVERNPWTLERR